MWYGTCCFVVIGAHVNSIVWFSVFAIGMFTLWFPRSGLIRPLLRSCYVGFVNSRQTLQCYEMIKACFWYAFDMGDRYDRNTILSRIWIIIIIKIGLPCHLTWILIRYIYISYYFNRIRSKRLCVLFHGTIMDVQLHLGRNIIGFLLHKQLLTSYERKSALSDNHAKSRVTLFA